MDETTNTAPTATEIKVEAKAEEKTVATPSKFKAVVEAINDPAAKTKLSSMGFDVIGSTPEQLAAVQKADLNKWEKPIKATGFQAD